MKIKEVCERTGLTERTVRFYMQKGLIAPKGEWRNGREYSEFSEPDVEMLQAVATLRELSFSIDEILTMQRTPGAIPSIVEARRDAARTQHETAENAYAVLGRHDPNGVSDVTALAARVREAAAFRPHPTPPPRPKEINNSGMGDRCNQVPFELKEKWNWGAFLMPVIWGLANHVYQALWCFVPIIGFFYSFYLGAHGNEFAWKHHYWESVEEFRRVQRKWAVWAICINVAILALYVGTAISSNRAAKQAELIYETRLAALEESIKNTPEWQELTEGRAEWTDERAREAFDAFPSEQARQDAGVFNRSDTFYLEPDAYYQVLRSSFTEFGKGQNAAIAPNGVVVFDDADKAHAVYSCRIALSNGEIWDLTGDADADARFTNITATLDTKQTAERRAYWEAVQRAAAYLQEYTAQKTEEISASALWQEKIGPDYAFTEGPAPAYISYDNVYNGGDVECGGYYARVRAADGTLWHVHIDVNYDEASGKDMEGELRIEEVTEEAGN